MNAKTILRVLIVVLATLALTALVAAQDAPAGPGKAAPVAEIGESGSPAANKSETEPNNETITADWLNLGDVIAGKIDSPGDVDYYALGLITGRYMEVMADIDAQMVGSPLDAKICLFENNGTVRTCSDDSNGLDPMVWGAIWREGEERPAYLRVSAYDPGVGGDAYTYRLAVYRPLFVSPAKVGTVAGIKFQAADVLSHYDFADGTEKWMLFFDASDTGITKNVTALHNDPGYTTKIVLVLGTTQSMWIEDEGVLSYDPVTPYDAIAFDYGANEISGGSLGPNTSGDFEFENHYKPEGLTAAGEKIDALADWYEFSTIGAAKFPANGARTQDEDIVFALYGAGYLDFDGSLIPGLGAEDVVGADQGVGDLYYLTIKGSGRIDGHTFTEKDIFIVDSETNRVVAPFPYWHGPDHHFNYSIDAIDAVNN